MHETTATPTSVKLVISSEVRLVDLVHAASERMAALAGFDDDESLNVGLAVREAVINAIVHGNREDPSLKVNVTLSAARDELKARVWDQGEGFDPTAAPNPTEGDNLLKSSGRGLLLIRAFVDEVAFRRRKGRGTEVVLVKRRNGSSSN